MEYRFPPLTPGDIDGYTARKLKCSALLEGIPNDQADVFWSYLIVREYWMALGATYESMEPLRDPDVLQKHLDDNPPVRDYYVMAEDYEADTGGSGKYVNDKCEIDWVSVACTAYAFANDRWKLKFASTRMYDELVAPVQCPDRLASEKGPQPSQALPPPQPQPPQPPLPPPPEPLPDIPGPTPVSDKETKDNTLLYVGIGLAAVAAGGLAVVLFKGK